jgi:hypothetical protein
LGNGGHPDTTHCGLQDFFTKMLLAFYSQIKSRGFPRSDRKTPAVFISAGQKAALFWVTHNQQRERFEYNKEGID